MLEYLERRAALRRLTCMGLILVESLAVALGVRALLHAGDSTLTFVLGLTAAIAGAAFICVNVARLIKEGW